MHDLPSGANRTRIDPSLDARSVLSRTDSVGCDLRQAAGRDSSVRPNFWPV